MNERQHEPKPKSPTEMTRLANHLTHFHMTNVVGSRSIVNNIIRQVVALNTLSGETHTKLSDTRQLDMEEHSGGRETLARDSNASNVSSRYVVEESSSRNQAKAAR